MSHSGLAYAACPMCTRVVHMGQMLHHILSTHKEQDAAYWTRLCYSRLALYERVTGAPLEGTEAVHGTSLANGAVGVADASGAEAVVPDGIFLATSRSAYDELRPYLPTVSESGAYTCNWCAVRSAAFSSRDAFLLHVAKDHPKLDFDVVESLVPQPPTASSRAARSNDADPSAARTTVSEDDVAMSDSWTPQQHGGAGSVGAASNSRWGAKVLLDVASPVRRMPGVRTVEETNVVVAKLEARQLGVSVGRIGEKVFDPAPISTGGGRSRAAVFAVSKASTTTSASDLHFAEDRFPCELCYRVFLSELNLLQHLEKKHTTTTTFASAKDAASPSDAGVEQPTSPSTVGTPSPGAASASSAEILVMCDHCAEGKKIFRSSSALFSHIRFRHPAEDAAYETERMIEEQKQRRVHQCPQCGYRFPDAARLDVHMRDAHRVVDRASESSVSGVPQALGPAALKSTQSSLFSALPPLTARTRFWCNACERGFSNASALYAHTESKHVVVARLYPCPACKREFRDVSSLELHISVCHKSLSLQDMGIQSSVKCPDCQRHFLDHESLHEHAVRHHGKSVIAPVRSFLTPASTFTTGDGVGTAAAAAAQVPGASTDASGSTTSPPAVSAPPKPRKLTRRKKGTLADTAEP
ncbi:Zincfinger of C2H2 type [Leishmania braziliensis]|nr:Zincfinger of C2H2 type [Leishmania braziliensis]